MDYRAHHPPPLSPGLWHLHSIVTPLNPSHPLSHNDDTYPAINSFTYSYQHLIRTLLFLQLCSQPDISFVVHVLSQFCSVPLPHHYAIAHWILCYLKGTKYFQLHLTLDFWHYCMGHPRELGRLAFLKFTTDVSFITAPLMHCEFCIFGKQAHLPAPASCTPHGCKPDIPHLHFWGTCCFMMVMSYLPGKCGYHNIPYNSKTAWGTWIHQEIYSEGQNLYNVLVLLNNL